MTKFRCQDQGCGPWIQIRIHFPPWIRIQGLNFEAKNSRNTRKKISFLQLMALPVLRSRSRSFFDGAQAELRLYWEVILPLGSKLACQTSPPATLLTPPYDTVSEKFHCIKLQNLVGNFQITYFLSQRIPVTVKFL